MPETDKLNTTPSKKKNRYSDDPAVLAAKRTWTPFQLQLYNNYYGSIASQQEINPQTGRGYAQTPEQKRALQLKVINAIADAQPHEYEDYASWVQRVGQFDPGLAKFITSDAGYSESDFAQATGYDPEKRRAWEQRRALDEFTKEMMGPLDLNDPETKRILDNVQSRIRTSNRGAGIGGGMARTAEARGVGDAILGETARRKEIGLRAMGMGMTNTNAQVALGEEAANRKALVDYQNQLSDFEGRRSNMQLGFGIAGGVIGAVAGGYASGGMGAVSGAGAGIAGGAALGGLAAGAPPQQPQRRGGGMTGSGY